MCLLVESIKIQDGKIHNLFYNNQRFNTARKEVFGANNSINLEEVIVVPDELKKGVVKCRVLYKAEIEKIELAPYIYRPIKSLKILQCNTADYTYKAVNRDWIDNLYKKKGNCDDILIIKNGNVTDTSRANIIFYDGEKWITPTTYLLKGTQRDLLLSRNLITEEVVKVEDIHRYQKARAINSFLDLEIGDDVPIDKIIY